MDLTKSWDRTSPPLTGLPKPVGPPAVSNGYLWTSYESLYLYGGIYSDSPPAEPDPVSVWEYRIADQEWIEHASPETTGGNNSAPAGQPVGRSGEGAGLSIPELGLSYYFGGHQDLYTTQGWSNQIARIYLKSMLEFTHPGYMNTGVEGLGIGGSGAPENGAYRNITEGGLQDTAGFTERADGVLVYVPGWGESGIVLGLAGGTNATFTDINTIDIYDVATSTWYKQSTSGTAPSIRVNPCAVVFAAPDASSFNVYLYGGQNLIPYGEQVQKDDVWILSIPSFTWVQADTKDQSVPPARAGHTCHAWDGQMVVVGGYVGQDLSCDSPGIYVFDASKLEWTNTFTAVEGSVPPASLEPNGIGSGRSRQTEGGDGEGDEGEEEGTGSLYAGLVGSNGYLVPEAVVAVIGGSPSGSATVTAPSIVPTEGPIATGKPPVFTITAPGTTVTSAPTGAPGSPGSSGAQDSGPNKPAIIAGVIAGVLGLVAAYLAFCTWLYRRQLRLYKDHVAMAQRAQFNNSPNAAGMHEKTHTNLHSSGGPGAPVVGAFGTVLSPGTARASDDPQGRSSLGSSAGGQLGGGLARPEFAKLQQDSNVTRATGGTTDEGYLAGLSGEGSQSGGRRSGSVSSEDDLLGAMEPSFISVVMSPRRTLRVINRD